MLLMPRRVKHRKQHRGRRKGVAMRGNEIAFGQYGLQAQGVCWMDGKSLSLGTLTPGPGAGAGAGVTAGWLIV